MKNRRASTIKYDPLIHSVRTNILIGRAIVEYIRKYPNYSDSADLRIIGKRIFPTGYHFAQAEESLQTRNSKKKKAGKK